MPELPEVETISRELEPVLRDKTITAFALFWHRTAPDGERFLRQHILGKTVVGVFRRGKHICLKLENSSHITIHLRMTGKLLFSLRDKDKQYIRARFAFSGGTVLYFSDTRKFGRIKFWPVHQPLLPQLGPEPISPGNVRTALSNCRSRRSIKAVLLDQEVIAGIGNIYADEALFAAGIDPRRSLPALTKNEITALSKTVPLILDTAVKRMGTTFSDYRTTRRQPGSNQHFLKVYGRRDQPCYHCNTPIIRTVVSQRSTHLCPVCQPIEHAGQEVAE